MFSKQVPTLVSRSPPTQAWSVPAGALGFSVRGEWKPHFRWEWKDIWVQFTCSAGTAEEILNIRSDFPLQCRISRVRPKLHPELTAEGLGAGSRLHQSSVGLVWCCPISWVLFLRPHLWTFVRNVWFSGHGQGWTWWSWNSHPALMILGF